MSSDIKNVLLKIRPYIHKTPVFTSVQLNEISGAQLFFKCENFQKMGAFKMRGASNAVLHLSAEQLKKGVATHSSGNFAQALSLAAKKMNTKAYIVMPSNAPKIKKDAVKGYGGIITESGNSQAEREEALKKVVAETGATFIHPYNDIHVIKGQATAAYELLEETGPLDYIFSPVGGGGLISGTCLAVLELSPATRVIGGEPMGADDAWQSLQTGKIIPSTQPATIADGLRTSLGDITFPIIQKNVAEIIRVEEAEIISAMRLIWERMKIIIEPSSAVPFAAVLKNKEQFSGKKVGIILSGGNVDLAALPF